MIGVGVIGYGYWGPNLVRSFSHTPGVEVRAVADSRADRLAVAQAVWPGIRVVGDASTLIDDPAVDAVVVASPARSHFELALASVQAGKHVLVEKPLADTSVDAARLVEEADRRGRILMVDHTFVYTGAVRQIRDIVAAGTVGEILFYDAVRTSLHRFHPETGVLWDLAVHDLAIIAALIAESPDEISATGLSTERSAPPDVVHVVLRFGDRRIAHVHANWLSAVKLRRTVIGGERGTIVYDDLDPLERVRVYDCQPAAGRDAAAVAALRVDYRAGSMWAPRLPLEEPLRAVAAHFVDCIESGSRPRTDGESALRVVRWLEAAERSMAQRGGPVPLS